MINSKNVVLGVVILTTLLTVNFNIAHAQRRQCDPNREECPPSRKMQQKAKLLPGNMLVTHETSHKN